MNPIHLIELCKDALGRGSIDMPLIIPGSWGKRDYRYLNKRGSPKGEIVKDLGYGIVVMFPIQETLDYALAQLAGICREIGCSGISPETCPGDPRCDILRRLLNG